MGKPKQKPKRGPNDLDDLKTWRFRHDFTLPHDAYLYAFDPVLGDGVVQVAGRRVLLRDVTVKKASGEPGASEWIVEGYLELDDPADADEAYQLSWDAFLADAHSKIENHVFGIESDDGSIEAAPAKLRHLKNSLMPPG